MKIARRTLLAGIPLALAPRIVAAQLPADATYPSKPVRIIVAFPPGQAVDTLTRILAEQMSSIWGQPVVIENRTGASGNIGTEAAARSPADGYTLLAATSSTFGINPSLYSRLPYDPGKDFRPIALAGMIPLVVVVPSDFPASNIAELVAEIRRRPGQINYATGGAGTSQHLATELLAHRCGLSLVHVPYRGSGPAMTDLIGGRIPLMIDSFASVLPHVRDGKIKALAVTTRDRVSVLPEVPTLHETVSPGYDLSSWYGFVGPAAMPQAIVDRVAATIGKALSDQALASRLLESGAPNRFLGPSEFGGFLTDEQRKFGEIVRMSGAKAE